MSCDKDMFGEAHFTAEKNGPVSSNESLTLNIRHESSVNIHGDAYSYNEPITTIISALSFVCQALLCILEPI